MTDPTHDTLHERLWSWFKGWGWIWLTVMVVMFTTLYVAGKLAP